MVSEEEAPSAIPRSTIDRITLVHIESGNVLQW